MQFFSLNALVSDRAHQVAPCYPRASNEFPRQISSMLLRDYTVLGRDSRSALVHGLVLLRNKLVTPLEYVCSSKMHAMKFLTSPFRLLQTLFPLLPRTTSATLRSFIRKTILTELKAANLKAKNHKMNRAVQAMMFDMVEKGTDVQMQSDNKSIRYRSAGVMTTSTAIEEALWAVTLARELWVCRVWCVAFFIRFALSIYPVIGMMPKQCLLLRWLVSIFRSKCRVQHFTFSSETSKRRQEK